MLLLFFPARSELDVDFVFHCTCRDDPTTSLLGKILTDDNAAKEADFFMQDVNESTGVSTLVFTDPLNNICAARRSMLMLVASVGISALLFIAGVVTGSIQFNNRVASNVIPMCCFLVGIVGFTCSGILFSPAQVLEGKTRDEAREREEACTANPSKYAGLASVLGFIADIAKGSKNTIVQIPSVVADANHLDERTPLLGR